MRKIKKLVGSSWLAAQAMAMSAGSVLAKNHIKDVDLVPEGQFNPLKDLTFASLVSNLIKLTLIVAALVFFFWLVFGGIRWMMSGGDKAKTEEARGQITAALIGLVIVFSAWAIAQLIKAFFGVDILQLKLSEINSF